jgi:hypothetical protein
MNEDLLKNATSRCETIRSLGSVPRDGGKRPIVPSLLWKVAKQIKFQAIRDMRLP